MAMSGGKSAVPQWWTDQRQPQAHERLLGSIQFYRSKWEGGAHWESSEDRPRPGLDPSLQATAPDVGQKKDWPGYDTAAANEGYTGRYAKCKQNRAAFETSSQKPVLASDEAVCYVNSREENRTRAEATRVAKETRQNFDERQMKRDANKKIGAEVSAKLIKERPQYVAVDTMQTKAASQGDKSDWYGRKNTCPW
jgi:hypothetical protein